MVAIFYSTGTRLEIFDSSAGVRMRVFWLVDGVAWIIQDAMPGAIFGRGALTVDGQMMMMANYQLGKFCNFAGLAIPELLFSFRVLVAVT